MFTKPVHRDPSLTPMQRAYVLGIKPKKSSFAATTRRFVLLSAQCMTMVAFAISVTGHTLPSWAANSARFWAWTIAVMCAITIVGLFCAFLLFLWIFTNAKSERNDSKEMKILREFTEDVLAGIQHTGLSWISNWVFHVSMIVLIAVLAMSGYVFLPLILAIQWVFNIVFGIVCRNLVVEAVKVLVPESITETSQSETNGKAVVNA